MKAFTIYTLGFIQREEDGRINATVLCTAKNKLFGNWYRLVNTRKLLKDDPNSVLKTNKHSWISTDYLQYLVEWLLRDETIENYNYNEIIKELEKPFPAPEPTQPITAKKCSKCKEELSVENFGKNKNQKDGFDRRCLDCYKDERVKNSEKNSSRSLEYYHEHKEQCAETKSQWQKANVEKTRTANRKAYTKKIEQEAEETKQEAAKLVKTITNFNQLVLKDKTNNDYQVVCRESDGYIDVTNLCKAGGRLYKNWIRLDKTKEFLAIVKEDIESEYQNPAAVVEEKSEYQNERSAQKIPDLLTNEIELIKVERTGPNEGRGTWVHPRVAINIAQWICPKFDVQVSKWVHQLLVLGQVKITDKNTDSDIIQIQTNKQTINRLVSEGKEENAMRVMENMEEKLKQMENKNKMLIEENTKLQSYLERKRRVQYQKDKVIYILKHNRFEGHYKVGISNYLTTRLSTYNTGVPEENYEVVYRKYTMYNSVVEIMIKKKFMEYLSSANKEWYNFPEGPGILMENIETATAFFGEE